MLITNLHKETGRGALTLDYEMLHQRNRVFGHGIPPKKHSRVLLFLQSMLIGSLVCARLCAWGRGKNGKFHCQGCYIMLTLAG